MKIGSARLARILRRSKSTELKGFFDCARIVSYVTSPATLRDCFLCRPERRWTWHESLHFRAVLGLGPIGGGYTLIAAREHVPSMMDLDDDLIDELGRFTAEVRRELERLWGPAVIGEHGRVAACVATSVRRHEPHCLHAHQLVFPGHGRLDLRAIAPLMPVAEFSSIDQAHNEFRWSGQYIYVETPDGRCQVGAVHGPLPRQFLRAIVATQQGHPELADWRSSPRPYELDAAMQKLRVRQPA
jgi:hypothetical protein